MRALRPGGFGCEVIPTFDPVAAVTITGTGTVVTAPTIVDVFLAQLDDDALDVLADRLAPRLESRFSRRPIHDAAAWLDTKRAADYLGMTTHGLYKLTAGRLIPFEQEGPGCRCWFKRTDLDDWREHGGTRAIRAY